jgi:ribonuclease-3
MTTRRRKSAARVPSNQSPALPWDHHFKHPDLLTLALTHSSLAYETHPETLLSPASDNEQLEFVGDAVLGLAVAESLYRRFPHAREGELTRLRASLVSRRHLGAVAQQIALGAMLRLGRGEEQSGGRQKPALLANALEAVIAALYLDGGLEVARTFIERHIIEPSLPELQGALSAGDTFSGAIGDHKSALQEHLQAIGAGQPQYVLTAQSGPDHQKLFRVEVHIPDGHGGTRALAESEGSTKKQAQQQAARIAFERLQAERNLTSLSAEEPTVEHRQRRAGAAR